MCEQPFKEKKQQKKNKIETITTINFALSLERFSEAAGLNNSSCLRDGCLVHYFAAVMACFIALHSEGSFITCSHKVIVQPVHKKKLRQCNFNVWLL